MEEKICNRCHKQKNENDFRHPFNGSKKTKYCSECRKKALGYSEKICVHDKKKRNCKECRPKLFCVHDKKKESCKECSVGSRFCEHRKYKKTCKLCKGIEKFNIVEGKNCFCIRWKEENCRKKEKKVRFGKTHTKEEAYIKIQHEKKKLDEKYISFEDICSFDDNF
jgi:hypothetical protein